MPAKARPATQRTQLGAVGTRSAATNAASVAKIAIAATTRFENSMNEW